jgi:hypothetical protein
MLSSQCESDSQAESSAHNPFFTKDVLESFDNDENNCAQKDDKYGDNPQQGDASQHDAPKSDDGKNGDDGNADHNDHDDSDEGNDNYNDVPRDLIAFLAMVQKYKIDFLPTMWQSALGVLGKGGFGMVNQAPISTTMNFAFKRFHGTTDSGEYLLPLISEVSILSQPLIQDHPNIVDLEGVCWEIKPSTQEAVPVLVFEKGSCGDLKQFMKAGEGMNMSFDDRIKICVDIGGAIMTLHTCGM